MEPLRSRLPENTNKTLKRKLLRQRRLKKEKNFGSGGQKISILSIRGPDLIQRDGFPSFSERSTGRGQ